MTKLKLKVQERFGIIRLLNEVYAAKGLDLQGLNAASKLVEKVVLTEKDQKDLEWKVDDKKTTWNTKKDIGKDIEFNSSQEKMLKELIEKKNTDKTLGVGDAFLIGLAVQLGMIEEDKE